jgi:hypothetical protein
MLKAYQFIMAAAALVLGLLCIQQRRALSDLPAAPLAKALTEAPLRAPAPAESAFPAPPPSPTMAGGEATQDRARMPDVVTELLNNPDNLETIRSFSSPELDSLYAPLFRSLGLSVEVIDQFKDLVTARKIAQAELRIRELEATGPEEQRLIQEQRARAMTWFEDRLRDLLGTGSYAMLEGYDKSLAERTMLFDYKQGLENVGAALSYEQEDVLIRLMYEERTASPTMDTLFSAGGSVLTEVASARDLVLEFDAWRDRVLVKSQGVLASNQFFALDQHLRAQSVALHQFLEVPMD